MLSLIMAFHVNCKQAGKEENDLEKELIQRSQKGSTEEYLVLLSAGGFRTPAMLGLSLFFLHNALWQKGS